MEPYKLTFNIPHPKTGPPGYCNSVKAFLKQSWEQVKSVNNVLCFHVQGVFFFFKWTHLSNLIFLSLWNSPAFPRSLWLWAYLSVTLPKLVQLRGKKKNANAVWITRQYVLAKAASMLLRQWPTVFNTALPAKGHFPFGCSALTLKPRKSCCCCLSRKHPSTVTNTRTRPPHTFPLINNSKVTSYEYKQALKI